MRRAGKVTLPSVAKLTQQVLAKGYQTAGPPDGRVEHRRAQQ
jgi:hypothetical protein